jgi:hypothetical protein
VAVDKITKMKCLIITILIFVVFGCNSTRKNSNEISQVRINRATYWKSKGYTFDPNSMTTFDMDQKVEALERAKYWKERGHIFDPNTMTTGEMNAAVKEIEKIQYWNGRGQNYDPNTGSLTLNIPVNSSEPSWESSRDNINLSPETGQWKVFETTNIDGMVKTVKRGTIFKTMSGNIYEVIDIVILIELELYPEVVVLNNGTLYKLFIQDVGEPLLCKKLNSGNKGIASGPTVIEARITNDFNGFEYGNIYKLSNGQVWEQTDFYIYTNIAVMPKVTIWKDGTFYKMKVDGIDKTVTVRQLE